MPQNVEKLFIESEIGRIVLKWEPVEGASKYRVYRKGPNGEEFKPIGETSEITYTDSNVKPGVRYRYKEPSICLKDR